MQIISRYKEDSLTLSTELLIINRPINMSSHTCLSLLVLFEYHFSPVSVATEPKIYDSHKH